MNSQESKEGQPEVPTQMFEQFLASLRKAEIPSDVVQRLQHTILVERDLSDHAVKAALFPEIQLNDYS